MKAHQKLCVNLKSPLSQLHPVRPYKIIFLIIEFSLKWPQPEQCGFTTNNNFRSSNFLKKDQLKIIKIKPKVGLVKFTTFLGSLHKIQYYQLFWDNGAKTCLSEDALSSLKLIFWIIHQLERIWKVDCSDDFARASRIMQIFRGISGQIKIFVFCGENL